MKYIYTTLVDGKEEKSECEIERWAWGVVYKPTEKQIEEAKKETEVMHMELSIERNKLLAEMRKRGETKEFIDRVIERYKEQLLIECVPQVDELKQFDDDGNFHRFGEIEQERVDIFTMYKTDDEKMLKRIDMKVSEGAKIFHFYRNIGFDYQSRENYRKVQVYVFGWKKDGACSYNYILPDDRIVVADHDIDITNFNI